MMNHVFSQTKNKDFASTLKERVNAYFKNNEISQNSNTSMKWKTVSALSLYLIPFFVMLIVASMGFHSTLFFFLCWILMGLGVAFVGTSVMHDLLHGAYSKRINKLLVTLPNLLLGADPLNWKIQHNVLHHTYTNIEHVDEDISPRIMMRFTPNQPKLWVHRYQYIYAPFFYSLMTFFWILFKDYVKIVEYNKKGLLPKGVNFKKALTNIILRKIFYLTVFLVLPMWMLPVPIWLTFLMFSAMHMIAGLLLAFFFQMAHVMEGVKFIEQEEELIDENWLVHQFYTTSNFAPKNKFLRWYAGGLTHQIEHHLFPHICHIHYAKIAPIVERTAREFKIPYHVHETFGRAIQSHFRHLKLMGQ